MRIAALLLVVALLAMPVPAQPDGVRIVELLPDPGEGREFIELHAAQATNITGWTIDDAAGQVFTFGPTHLAAGQRIVVWGGGDADAAGPAWNRATVWNNGGDTATLRDATGRIVDTFTYGPGGDAPAPSTGRSAAWLDGRWIDAEPTPGHAPRTASGTASATVANAPPTATLAVPAHAAPGQTIAATIAVHDPNGDAVHWTLADAHGAGNATIALTAPDQSGTWLLHLEATDGHHTVLVERHVSVQGNGLRIELPPEGLAFPAFLPGQQEAASNPFTIHNDGSAATPRIDVSDLQGPATIPVDGRLVVHVNGTAIPYDGPLTPLPPIAAGASMQAHFVLHDIPAPLPAGDYGTSFTVIA